MGHAQCSLDWKFIPPLAKHDDDDQPGERRYRLEYPTQMHVVVQGERAYCKFLLSDPMSAGELTEQLQKLLCTLPHTLNA